LTRQDEEDGFAPSSEFFRESQSSSQLTLASTSINQLLYPTENWLQLTYSFLPFFPCWISQQKIRGNDVGQKCKKKETSVVVVVVVTHLGMCVTTAA
jgi:hypothetical protein